MYIKFLPKVRGGAQRAEGSVVLRALLYDWQLLFLLSFWGRQFNTFVKNISGTKFCVIPCEIITRSAGH